MQSTSSELEEKTRAYWELSSAYQGRISKRITAQTAIKTCVNTIAQLGSHRNLYGVFDSLKREIISGESTVKEIPAKVLPMARMG